MRGINRVIVSGNVGDRVTYGETRSGVLACSFAIASDRYDGRDIVTAWVRANVYGDDLVRLCKERLVKGCYLLIEGELMNRDGKFGELTEIRARDIVFLPGVQGTVARRTDDGSELG